MEELISFFEMFLCWLMAYCAWAYYAGQPPVAHRCAKCVVCNGRLYDLNRIYRNIKKDSCEEVSWLSWLFCLEHFESVIRIRHADAALHVMWRYLGNVFAVRTLLAICSALVLGTKFKYEIRLENNPYHVFIYTFSFIGRGRGRLKFRDFLFRFLNTTHRSRLEHFRTF